MKEHTSLLFENDNYGTVLFAVDEEITMLVCITTKASYKPLMLSASNAIYYLPTSKRKYVSKFDSLMYSYAPVGRAFLGAYQRFTTIKNGEPLKVESIKDLEVGEVYHNCEFDHFMKGENYTGALTYKGIFPGTFENFCDLYKEVMFEESLKAAKNKDEIKECGLRTKFKLMLEKGEI